MKTNSIFAIAAAISLLAEGARAPLHAADGQISSLPAGVIREGSLANKKLIYDTRIAAAGKLAQMGYTFDPRRHTFQPYVVSMPRGNPGQRHWTERWVCTIDGKTVPMTIDFREDGLGAADYTIRH